MEETRWRDGKLEKKDPITGVWVIHPAQFFADNQEAMEKMYKEIEEDDERQRKEMFDIKKAENFIRHDVGEYDEEAKEVTVEKVINVNLKGGFSRENSMELIFDGKLKGKPGRFLAGCWSYSGDFYEPPSEECWFDDFREAINRLEKSVEKHTTPKGRWLDPEKTMKGLTADDAFSPIKTKEQYTHEKLRLENIYHKDIERLNYLKKYHP